MPLASIARRTRLSHSHVQPLMRSIQKRSHALSLSASVGLALGLLAALMLGVLLTTWVVLRVKRGPGVTLQTLFSRQPIPPVRRPDSDPSDPAVESAKPLNDLPSKDDHTSQDFRRIFNASPRRISRPMSQYEYLNIHEKTADVPTAVRTAPSTDPSSNSGSPFVPMPPIARLGPVRTMSEADIRRGLPPSPLDARTRTIARLAGTAPQEIQPPAFNLPWKEEFYVPDSPEDHIIVLPSPRDLKTFRLTMHA
ncbi:uncharacterized protein BO97DRAFT_429149 [Aspergillus homomorphus CBS 101889]|uniref:Uncharacterized protein n=1 Tax=Aspergillus homomorphus (strain CBS 101889) TaxID=1450537 RepID=A0A395HJQ4_ASPHC|nr:hypothetical protein BO97DRAFT_429149 [Aspergillus homomorphus CBS 101889]RAL07653.1 hypothetical protein BO97DRAFT_429149 [Aspergillus homomorphus CBS 101889]